MDLKLWCDSCIKFQLFEGAQTFLWDWHLFCMFLHHNPYRLPQHYKCMCVGPPVAVNIIFVDISDFFALVLSELCGCSVPLTLLVNSYSLFRRPVLIFQHTMNYVASDNQSTQCQHLISQLGKMCSYYVSAYISVFVEGYILLPEWKPDLQGSCSIARDSSLPNRSEQNSCKLRHTVCDIL
jgi:hypothetical protein